MLWAIIVKRRQVYYVITSLMVISLICGILGIDYWSEMELASIPDQPTAAPTGRISIVVRVPIHMLEVYNDGTLYKRYRVAVGRNETPTPIGEWTVIWKSYRSGDIFGTRFLGLDVPWGGYGIHGTNQPWSIGRFISQGCIRMRNRDIEELFEWVPVGTPVRIEDREFSIHRILKYEDSGTDVVQLQVKLRNLGYFEGRADGFFNKDTEMAVKRFQHDRGMGVSGVADRKVLDCLGF